MTAAEVADRVGSDLRRGLVEDEVRRRQAAFGPNRLPEEKVRPAWLRLAEQFRSVLILVLIGAAVLAGLVGDLLDMIVILAVVAFNALLGFYQERRAGKILESLRRMLAHQSTVRRAGVVCRLNSDAIVPGMWSCSRPATAFPPTAGCSPTPICRWTSPR